MDGDMLKWALAELHREYPDPDDKVRQTVTALLDIWSRMSMFAKNVHAKIDEEKAIEIFTTLVQGRPLEPDVEPRVGAPLRRAERLWTVSHRPGH